MVQFKLEVGEGEFTTGWVQGAQGGQALASSLTFVVAPQEWVTLGVRVKFTDDQARNFVSLMCKSWVHICFIAGVDPVWITPPVNPWISGRGEAIVWHRIVPTIIAVTLGEESEHTFLFKFKAGMNIQAAGSLVLRLANLAEWSLRYSDRIKLTSPNKFKWATFNQISVNLEPGVGFPTRQERGTTDNPEAHDTVAVTSGEGELVDGSDEGLEYDG